MKTQAEAARAARARGRTAALAPAERYQPPYLAAGLAGLAVLVLYAVTLAPTTQFWDTSEYIATAHMLGIPHPPGNPLFVVFARAWELLLAPTGLSVAVRVNLFSAIMSALAHACWFLLAHRILAFYSANRMFRLVGAAAAVLVSATAFTVWNHSNVNEKVYTVSLFTIALLSWLAFHWRDHLGEGKDDNLILLMIFILALSVGNHLMAFLAAPALVLFILLVEPRTLLNWRLYAAGAAVGLLGLSIHLFLPLRASLGPVINEADPSTWQALWESLTRQQYNKPSMFINPVFFPQSEIPRDFRLLAAQLGNYLQYFDWQFARSVAGFHSFFGGARPLFTALFAALGLYGAWSHYRRDRISWAYLATLLVVLSLGLVFYLNFRYGYSYPIDVAREAREVRERDYFFIVSFSLWGVWVGIGLAALWQLATDWVAERAGAGLPATPHWLRTSPLLALALIPLALNWGWASRAGDYTARDWAYNLLMSVEPYGVLFTNGDNDTFPLWYLQEVEGIRKDVMVIVMSYLNTPWYARQIRDLTTPCPPGLSADDDRTRIICQRPYLVDQGPSFYAPEARATDRAAQSLGQPASPGRRAPTRSILPFTNAELAQITSAGLQLQRDAAQLELGSITATIPAGSLLTPADLLMGYIIGNSLDDRPIYFASTTDAYEIFGLRDQLIRQGVAFKLSAQPLQTDPELGLVEMPPQLQPVVGRYLDLPRTDSLLWNVYQHRSGLPDRWTRWVDAATQSIPWYYLYTHYAAAQGHASLENLDQAARHMERADAWQRLGRLGTQ
jgi:hypothetical protein